MLEFIIIKHTWFFICFYLECMLLRSLLSICYWVHYVIRFTLKCVWYWVHFGVYVIQFTMLLDSLWVMDSTKLTQQCCWVYFVVYIIGFTLECILLGSLWSVYYWVHLGVYVVHLYNKWVHFGVYEFLLSVWNIEFTLKCLNFEF